MVTEPSGEPLRLPRFFEATCDVTPSAVALECEDDRLTYQELDERANRLAHHLIGAGVSKGTRAGILLERSVESYVALLAVLKAGAAFVPIDPASPQERVEFIADDAAITALLASTRCSQDLSRLTCPILRMEEVEPLAKGLPAHRPDIDAEPDPACYVIYTSGSSGRPKGVEVAQSSICNFIDVVTPLYGVSADDRVYQGMTLAFDFSIEEIWPTWAAGATVVAGPTDDRRIGSGLTRFLAERRVTVLYCVPTVLATIDQELPGIHTLLVGGEACPAELVERWSRGGRRMLNTYGPTEATVTATWAELHPGRPVTIGRPLPTYEVDILDHDLLPVPDGDIGEICISGVGVARGYVNRPDLTAERFVDRTTESDARRLYRTGDLGRTLANGEIEYLGRADSEVKVRGHRVDLQEIESLLLEHDGVASAVVKALPGGAELAAYVTLADPDVPDLVAGLHSSLRRHLPGYMVPSFIEVLTCLPMLPSGKVDRSALPQPSGSRLVSSGDEHEPPATPLEKSIAEVWADALDLAPDTVSVHADFFADLGGHSLLAATLVSRLRASEVAPGLSVGDLYANPNIRSLATFLEVSVDGAASAPEQAFAARRHSSLRVALAGTAQACAGYIVLLLLGLPFALLIAAQSELTLTVLWQCVGVVAGTAFVGRLLVPVLAARLLSLGLRPGRYPLWGVTYLRLWLIEHLTALAPVAALSGSPLLAPYLRALGARVGRDCHIATGALPLPTFTEIGAGASIGYGARLEPTRIEGGWVILETVAVGAGAFVGANSVLMPGARLGENAELGEQSLLAQGQVVPAGQRWSGSPSVPQSEPDPVVAELARRGARSVGWSRKLLVGFAGAWLTLELLPLVTAAPSLALVFWALLEFGTGAGLLASLAAGPLSVLMTCLVVAVGKRLVLPSTPTGIHRLHTGLGLRKYVVDKLLESSLAATNSLYATLYTAPWLRALGATIGQRAEVSTVSHLDPDLLELGSECFVADMASAGPATYHRGHVWLGRTTLGSRSFLGNAALARSGARLAEDSLVGVHTLTPTGGTHKGTSWLGSPAIFLPRRQESDSFPEELTFRPTRARVIERLAIEFFRIVLPGTITGLAFMGSFVALLELARARGATATVLLLPLLAVAAALAVVLAVVLAKWIIVGRYRPRVEPLWSRFVRRTELVTGLYESAAVPVLLAPLAGTPMLPPLLRLFGARIGRRTWLATTYLTEFDLARVGDDAAIGSATSLQTHLFEDRVMKMSTVTIESGASVATRSVVLYDGSVGANASLDALSLVMKGEHLEPGTRWRGIPSQSI